MIQIQIPYYFYCLLILMVTDSYYSAVEGFLMCKTSSHHSDHSLVMRAS